MYILNGSPLDINQPQIVGENQYPAGWFEDAEAREAAGIELLYDTAPPAITSTQKLVADGYERDTEGRWVAKWLVADLTPDEQAEADAALASSKVKRNQYIDESRNAANGTTFPYAGKFISVDALGMRDLLVTAAHIGMTGTFPAGFPGGWKCTDKSYVALPTIDDFKTMFSTMAEQGVANFNHSQSLKAALAAATTKAEVAAIVW
jgi:hypothetical protein